MKRNILVVQTQPGEICPHIKEFCERKARSAYVYLIQLGKRAELEDTDTGVRIYRRQLSELPNFGQLDAVTVVGDADLSLEILSTYEECPKHRFFPTLAPVSISPREELATAA